MKEMYFKNPFKGFSIFHLEEFQRIFQGVEFRNRHTQELNELLLKDIQERSEFFKKEVDAPSPE